MINPMTYSLGTYRMINPMADNGRAHPGHRPAR
jgi:hypothetical protein